ncbi:hypothetical protein C8J57DRAFT_1231621 [Mycena rebaudengoi]|nr:hypothetical protein C8J57DRAFT_1231621 [Mycena rebaudengoi]
MSFSDTLRQECPRALTSPNAVFGVEGATPVSHTLTFPGNDCIIIHNSQGFEGGEDSEANIQKVFDFIDFRSKKPALGDQLHAIWVCAEIPFAGNRMFETGRKKLEVELEQRDEDMDDKEFEAEIDTAVDEEVQELCVKPLRALNLDNFQAGWVSSFTPIAVHRHLRDLVKTQLYEICIRPAGGTFVNLRYRNGISLKAVEVTCQTEHTVASCMRATNSGALLKRTQRNEKQ